MVSVVPGDRLALKKYSAKLECLSRFAFIPNPNRICNHIGSLFLQSHYDRLEAHPFPGDTFSVVATIDPLFKPRINPRHFHPKQSHASLFSISIDTSISSTPLPESSLSIAIMDAIGVLFHQQAANQLRGGLFCGAAEDGLVEVLGGYGSGSIRVC